MDCFWNSDQKNLMASEYFKNSDDRTKLPFKKQQTSGKNKFHAKEFILCHQALIRCGRVVTDFLRYPKFRKNLLSWLRIRSGFVIFAIQPMCRASEAFKIEALKNAYKKIWTKNSNAIVKNKHNVGWKNLKFEYLAVIGQFKYIKKN